MIPQVELWMDEHERAAVDAVLRSGWITEGPRAAEFARCFNALLGVNYGAFAPNGTLALVLALLALGIGPGDEVIIPDSTFIASANAVVMTGAKPVFVDVDKHFQIDPICLSSKLTSNTKAIMPVHLYGMAANMTAVMAFARRHGLKVVEDAAQGVGVWHKGKPVGTWGDVGCFSFFADKTLTMGEGGYVVTNDMHIYGRLRLLRNHGRINSGTFIHPDIGWNFRITDLQAAIGLAQFARLPEIIQRKQMTLDWYRERLADVPQVRILEAPPDSNHIPFRAVLLCERVRDLMAYLKDRDVEPRTFFYPLHRQPCFGHLNPGSDREYSNAVYGWEHGMCLPVFPTLKEDQVGYICSKIKEFYRG